MFFRRLRERALEFQDGVWFIFSDIKSAFDTVNRDSILNILTNVGLEDHYIELIKDSMSCTRGKVVSSMNESEFFQISNGVPQGSSLSPGLFISALGFAIQHAHHIHHTIHKEYADDLSNITHNKSDILKILYNNSKALELIGSTLEPSKTELFHVNSEGIETIYKARESLTQISLDSKFEDVFEKSKAKSLRYLGDQLGNSNIAIRERINKAHHAFGRLYNKVFSRENLTFKTKFKVFNASIVSICLMGLTVTLHQA